ncbi:DUF2283 domain-containing protein [Candidatus Aerophobetes bacterium]|nr:DUF2283 domain-containing protein [Candidatus Aerophobetes bacterium]
MAKEVITQDAIQEVFKATSHLLKFPVTKLWVDYDKEADVLYVSFKRPQKATDSEMLESGILLRYRQDEIVGITVLEASKR